MGSIFAEKTLYGSDAVITNPAKSGRASGSVSSGMRTGSCDFIFGAVPSSAVQDRSGYNYKLHNCWRIMQSRRLPGLAGSNAVKGENEIGYLGEDGARNDLMLRHHTEFSRHLRHPGGLESSVEVLGRPWLELQLILSTCWRNGLALGASGLH